MGKLPWFKFFPGAWKTDPCLSMCSATTRGIWMDLICAMDQQARKGEISGTVDQLSRIGRCTIEEFITAKDELSATGTANIKETGDIIKLTNRRMRKEDKNRAGNAKRQERFRENGGGDPERWTYIRAKILLMDEKRCAYCGKKATTVDHVLPRKQGGKEDENNLVACCKVCNCFKNNRTPEQANMNFHVSFKRLNDIVLFGSNGESNTEVTGRSKKLEVRSKKLEIQNTVHWDSVKQSFLTVGDWTFNFCRAKSVTAKEFETIAKGFINDLELKQDYKTLDEVRKHFVNWYNKEKAKVSSRQINAPSGPPMKKIQ